MRTILDHGTDCNIEDSDGMRPLVYAIIEDHEDVVKSLLSYGARIDNIDSAGRSALHWAVLHRRKSILELCTVHCNTQQTSIDDFIVSGMTPLHLAVDKNFEAGVEILLQHGANVSHPAPMS